MPSSSWGKPDAYPIFSDSYECSYLRMSELFIHRWTHTVMNQKLKMMHLRRNTWKPDCGFISLSLSLSLVFFHFGRRISMGLGSFELICTSNISDCYRKDSVLSPLGIQYWFYYSCYPVLDLRNEMFRFYTIWASWEFFVCLFYTGIFCFKQIFIHNYLL